MTMPIGDHPEVCQFPVHARTWEDRASVLMQNPGQWFGIPHVRGKLGGSLESRQSHQHVIHALRMADLNPRDFQLRGVNLPYVKGERTAMSLLFCRYVGPGYVYEWREPKESAAPSGDLGSEAPADELDAASTNDRGDRDDREGAILTAISHLATEVARLRKQVDGE